MKEVHYIGPDGQPLDFIPDGHLNYTIPDGYMYDDGQMNYQNQQLINNYQRYGEFRGPPTPPTPSEGSNSPPPDGRYKGKEQLN